MMLDIMLSSCLYARSMQGSLGAAARGAEVDVATSWAGLGSALTGSLGSAIFFVGVGPSAAASLPEVLGSPSARFAAIVPRLAASKAASIITFALVRIDSFGLDAVATLASLDGAVFAASVCVPLLPLLGVSCASEVEACSPGRAVAPTPPREAGAFFGPDRACEALDGVATGAGDIALAGACAVISMMGLRMWFGETGGVSFTT